MFEKNFFTDFKQGIDLSVFKSRRNALLALIKEQYPEKKNGIVLLFAGLETEAARFRQEKSFYYYTGVNEPGTVLMLDLEGKATLYVPQCFKARAQWMALPDAFLMMNPRPVGFDAMEFLGKECRGYGLYPFFSQEEYAHFVDFLQNFVARGGTVFTTTPDNDHGYVIPRFILTRLTQFIPSLAQSLVDISSCIAVNRRCKDAYELEYLYRAAEITMNAHEAAARTIKDGDFECEIQAALEYMITVAQARVAFPSIVATGKNSTVLHYTHNDAVLRNGDLVVVDIGAEYNNYCADITRTYPVSGLFTPRQREIYEVVLATQEYIADKAKPGYWLRNSNEKSRSLHHLAQLFLEKHGYDKYFPHGIGHFLGLDVHDVGDSLIPLQEGDVITIEPGIYIPEEALGIRIEDDYLLIKNGVTCISDALPKGVEELQLFMQQRDEEDADDESCCEDEHGDDDGEDELFH